MAFIYFFNIFFKSIAFLYTCNEQYRKKLRKNCIYNSINIGINLIKYIKDLYNEEYKMLMRDIEPDTNK